MPYFILSTVALVIHIIINVSMFYKRNTTPAMVKYRVFLLVVAIFYVTDIFWGVFYENKMTTLLYVDTFLYFATMGLTVFTWSIFVINYLQWKNKTFQFTVTFFAAVILTIEVVLLIVNCFKPIFFSIDEGTGEFLPLFWRRMTFYIQSLFYALLTLYSIVYSIKVKNKNYKRHFAIAAFSIIMFTCIAFQVYNPLIPYYPIGNLIGVCFLDFYVINEQKDRFKSAYQETFKVNEDNKEKLNEALSIAYTDPLTGVKNKHAFVEMEDEYDKLIATNSVKEFIVVVFDLNGLKIINDTQGHKAGDNYIKDSVRIIADYFPFDNIYRFGGDEFVVVLKNEEVDRAQKSHNDFMKAIDENVNNKKPVVASGMSKFKKNHDNTFNAVFYRADKMMYARKVYLKEREN